MLCACCSSTFSKSWNYAVTFLTLGALYIYLRYYIYEGFPCGSVVENLPASAGDMGLIPDLEGSHLLQNNKAQVSKLLSLHAAAAEASAPKACAPQREKSPQWEAGTLQLESNPHSPQLQKALLLLLLSHFSCVWLCVTP